MGEWHAVEALEESVNRTKELLLKPFDLTFWLKLAVVVTLATGLSSNGGNSMFDFAEDSGGFQPGVLAVAAIAFAVLVFIGLVLMYVSAVFQFVYVKAVVKKKIELIADFKSYSGEGLQLFLLEIVVYVAMFVSIIVGAILFAMTTMGSGPGVLSVFMIILAIMGLIAMVFAITTIIWVFTEFLVPITYARGKGIISSGGEFIKLVKANVWEFVLYTALKFGLGIVAGIVVFMVSIPFFLGIFLTSFMIYLAILFASGPSITPAALALIGAVTVGLIAANIVVSFMVIAITLPIKVFFRYYGLTFLNRIEPGLDLFKRVKKIKNESKEDTVKVY
ncbi:MAG: hypothetical protein GF416_08785 [Candidatus Altiarchaeales archaeon]|nr:hypothetical protein [Candidatus Altiarchaeales archaeon]MBD3417212.1 hypothetical protein [Candidatus Altiarchaeales archaeon]